MEFEKVTYVNKGIEKHGDRDQPTHGRWYADACAAAFAMELLGERWSLLLVRELMLGPLRFSRIRANLPGLSARVLTERLQRLEQIGILRRRVLAPPTSAQVYELTEWGYEAETVMQALGRWSVRSPAHDPTLPLTPVSAMLSLRTMILPDAACGFDAVVEFVFPDDRFVARLRDGVLAIARSDGPAAAADVTFAATSPNALLPYIYGKRPLAEVESQFGLSVTGDRALADRFAAIFALPPKCG